MSTTWNLLCRKTKQYVWIGQHMSPFVLYTGEPETMEALRAFLEETVGMDLVLVETSSSELDDCVDFMKPQLDKKTDG
jgi:hypothetical protein